METETTNPTVPDNQEEDKNKDEKNDERKSDIPEEDDKASENQKEEQNTNEKKEEQKDDKNETKKDDKKQTKKKEKKEDNLPPMLKNGLETTQILKKRVNNPRYLGFSQYFSSSTLQNSSTMNAFPKNKRFMTENLTSVDRFYNLPELKSTRKAGIGIGNRPFFNSFINKGCPPPDRYKIKSSFETNILHHKGIKILEKLDYKATTTRTPGVGTYNINKKALYIDIPVTIKSRKLMFYDEDLKKKQHCVSMQRYHPKTECEENKRFSNISFGIGERGFTINSMRNNPGPGAYKVPGIFDRGLKKKLVLN